MLPDAVSAAAKTHYGMLPQRSGSLFLVLLGPHRTLLQHSRTLLLLLAKESSQTHVLLEPHITLPGTF